MKDDHLQSINFLRKNKAPLLEEIDLVVALGGPNVTSDPNISLELHQEKQFLQEAVLLNKAVLGICFGMQVLGEALGGVTEDSSEQELGFDKIYLRENIYTDPVVQCFPKSFEAFHCHHQMCGLTKNALVLATSSGCPRQIVHFTKLAYGFQFHLEVDKKLSLLMLKGFCGERASFARNELEKANFSKMNHLLFLFLDSLIEHRQRLTKRVEV